MNDETAHNKAEIQIRKLHILATILISIASVVVISYFGFLIFKLFKQAPVSTKVSVQKSNTKDSFDPVAWSRQQEMNKTSPKTATEIIKENQKYMVMIICNTTEGTVQASGVIIGRDKSNNLLVLTNYHVVENYKMGALGQPPCAIKSDTDLWHETYYGQPAFYPTMASQSSMQLIDFALIALKTEPPIISEQIQPDGSRIQVETTKELLKLNSFPKICTANQLKIGEDLIILGYPDISGTSLPNVGSTARFTATEGIISSENTNHGYYFNTSAKIDHGNSGGGAFLKTSGCFAGVPTFVLAGELESLGRVLKIYKIYEEFLIKVVNNDTATDFNKWLDEGKIK